MQINDFFYKKETEKNELVVRPEMPDQVVVTRPPSGCQTLPNDHSSEGQETHRAVGLSEYLV